MLALAGTQIRERHAGLPAAAYRAGGTREELRIWNRSGQRAPADS